MSASRRLGIAGVVAGAAATGTAAVVARRRSSRAREQVRERDREREWTRRTGHDPRTPVPAPDRERTVVADDGTLLHVREWGDATAPLTVLFVHGYLLTADSWRFQVADLRDLGRLVTVDLRSHGRSGAAPATSCTIDQLGRDLDTVVRSLRPAGTVLLVGHSLGGMAVMALAGARPDWFGPRIGGVALLSTTAGLRADPSPGLPALAGGVLRLVPPRLLAGVGRVGLLERARGGAADVLWAVTRRLAYGSPDVPRVLADLAYDMIAATPLEVLAAFGPELLDHDRLAALPALVGCPTLVLVGEADLQTPVARSSAIVAAVPGAELVVVPEAGHLLQMERPDVVARELRRLAARVRARTAA